MRTTTWAVKLSRFCNMRCSYCYEWNHLSDRRRMSIELLKKVLRATAEYGNACSARFPSAAGEYQNIIVLHGGEPLALPVDYLREVIACFKEHARNSSAPYHLSILSNLLSVSDEKLALLKEAGGCVTVSYDGAPGVRLNLAGQATEATVAANLDRLLAAGIKLSGHTVLAKHTLKQVTRTYDFFAARGLPMRIIPLADGPTERPGESFQVEYQAIVQSLEQLFKHWIDTGCKVPVYPFVEHIKSAFRHLASLTTPLWDRSLNAGDGLVVNTDGLLYRVVDFCKEELALGNLGTQSIAEIIGSAAFDQGVQRERTEFEAHCGGCRYLGACNAYHIYDARMSSTNHQGNCHTAYHCIEFMTRYLKERGYGPRNARAFLEKIGQVQAVEALPGATQRGSRQQPIPLRPAFY